MSSTLSLSCSKKLYELLGDTYETGSKHCRERIKSVWHPWFTSNGTWPVNHNDLEQVPAPSFSETIRLLPRIGRLQGWTVWENPTPVSLQALVMNYMYAPTEEEGMEQVSNYLEALL